MRRGKMKSCVNPMVSDQPQASQLPKVIKQVVNRVGRDRLINTFIFTFCWSKSEEIKEKSATGKNKHRIKRSRPTLVVMTQSRMRRDGKEIVLYSDLKKTFVFIKTVNQRRSKIQEKIPQKKFPLKNFLNKNLYFSTFQIIF